MSDELLMNNYLMILKSTVEVYIHGSIESSNKSVRSTLKNSLDEILKSQEKTFDYMLENEWYCIDNVDPKEICRSINQN
jgi:spore coat protein CotF